MRAIVFAASLSLVAFSTGCSGPDCTGGAVACGDSCIVLSSDDRNCGACGKACEAGQVCTGGACLRTVSSWFSTEHWIDDGSTTTVTGPIPGATVSALVPDASPEGYRVLPGTVGLDGSVTVPDVPAGDYLLRVDAPRAVWVYEPSCVPACFVMATPIHTDVLQFTTSAPPLSRLVSYRSDLERTSETTPVQLNVTNLDTSSLSSSQLWASSSQADVDLYLEAPAAGVTELSGEVDWFRGFGQPAGQGGLPSAARGDLVTVTQRIAAPPPAWPNAALLRLTTRAAQLSDLTIVDGVGGTIDVALAEVPLSRSIGLDLAATAFQALEGSMAPPDASAGPPTLGASVYAAPHSASRPAPGGARSGGFFPEPLMRLLFVMGTGPFAEDANLGAIAYGGFLDPLWAEFLYLSFQVERSYPIPGTTARVWAGASNWVALPIAQVPAGKIGPVLGPPTALRIESRDAWAVQQGVGLTPLLSWGSPSLGAASAYQVRIVPVDPRESGMTARLYGVNSVRVPPGVLTAGRFYYAVVTALVGPGLVPDANPNVAGFPLYSADAMTALFSP